MPENVFQPKYNFVLSFQGLEQAAGRHRREDRNVPLLHDHLRREHHQRLHPWMGAHPRHFRRDAGKLDRLTLKNTRLLKQCSLPYPTLKQCSLAYVR